MTRKTRSDKGKPRKKIKKESTHIRVDLIKKPFLIWIAKMPLEFLRKLVSRNENESQEITRKNNRPF
jgi:hypothetical protein